MILTETEQGPLFNAINFGRPIQDPANTTMRIMRLAIQICPTDNQPATWKPSAGVRWFYGGTLYSNDNPIRDVAGSNHVGVFGVGEPGVDVDGDVVFFRNSFVRLAQIFDPDGEVCRHEGGSGMVLGHTGEGHGPDDPYGDVNQFLSRHAPGDHFLYGRRPKRACLGSNSTKPGRTSTAKGSSIPTKPAAVRATARFAMPAYRPRARSSKPSELRIPPRLPSEVINEWRGNHVAISSQMSSVRVRMIGTPGTPRVIILDALSKKFPLCGVFY